MADMEALFRRWQEAGGLDAEAATASASLKRKKKPGGYALAGGGGAILGAIQTRPRGPSTRPVQARDELWIEVTVTPKGATEADSTRTEATIV